MFRLLFAGGIQECARALAGDIARRYPAALANSPEPLVSQRRRSEILETVFLQARQFSQEHRLGVIGQIRLGGALKWQLKEMGYDEEFIDMAAELLAASVAREPT